MAACLLAMTACSDDDGGDDANAGTGGSDTGDSGTGGSGSQAGSSGGGGSGGSSTGTAGSSGSGAAGSSGSGASGSASQEDAGAEDDAGMDPVAAPTAVATISGFGSGTVTGTVTFTQDGNDVTVVIELENCSDGEHPVHIHEGTSCASEVDQGMHWDSTRGEGIPNVTCSGNTGTVTYTRTSNPGSTRWSIGGSANTDVVGHAFVVHESPSDATRIGCGVIES